MGVPATNAGIQVLKLHVATNCYRPLMQRSESVNSLVMVVAESFKNSHGRKNFKKGRLVGSA